MTNDHDGEDNERSDVELSSTVTRGPGRKEVLTHKRRIYTEAKAKVVVYVW